MAVSHSFPGKFYQKEPESKFYYPCRTSKADSAESLAYRGRDKKLLFVGSQESDHSLAQLENFPQLQELDLKDCQEVTQLDTFWLQKINRLTRVNLVGSAIPSTEWSKLTVLPHLQELQVEIHDPEDFQYLSELSLSSLRLRFAGATQEIPVKSWQKLSNIKGLRLLNLEFCHQLSPQVFETLAQIPSLQELELSLCEGITPQGIRCLQSSRLQRLSFYYSTEIDKEVMAHAREIPSLQVIEQNFTVFWSRDEEKAGDYEPKEYYWLDLPIEQVPLRLVLGVYRGVSAFIFAFLFAMVMLLWNQSEWHISAILALFSWIESWSQVGYFALYVSLIAALSGFLLNALASALGAVALTVIYFILFHYPQQASFDEKVIFWVMLGIIAIFAGGLAWYFSQED